MVENGEKWSRMAFPLVRAMINDLDQLFQLVKIMINSVHDRFRQNRRSKA